MNPPSHAETLLNVAYNVFLPPQLPQQAPSEDHERHINHQLVLLTQDAIDEYQKLASGDSEQWMHMSRMLSKFARNVKNTLEESQLQYDMSYMQSGDVLALHIREQNAAVLVRKAPSTTAFEIFEVQAPNESVMSIAGKLVRHFPGPAIEVPNSISDDSGFIQEIAHFLFRMNGDILEDAVAKTIKGGSTHHEIRDSADPHYISQLFTGILRGFGGEVEPAHRVVKRIADDVLWDNTYLPWRRSPIWLIIRVALQTSLSSTNAYKNFMAYLHARILSLCCSQSIFPDGLLFSMRSKLARRMLKIQDSVPDYIINAATAASDETGEILRERWETVQGNTPRFQPLVLDLDRAVVQSLPNSRDYLSKILQGRDDHKNISSFSPNHHPRLTGDPDFAIFANGALTTSFKHNEHLALFDFEHAVHNYLPTWITNNITGRDSCATVFSCFEQYISVALNHYTYDVADRSIMILTVMELWVALDRLATSQHSLLLDYSPEIPEDIIEVLLLRSSLHLERASMVQKYLRRRHADSRATGRGSVFTARATSNSLSVRFFERSSNLQKTKWDIEREAERERANKVQELHRLNAEHAQLLQSIAQSSCEYNEDWRGYQRHSRWCCKCSMQDRARLMSIQVHEWPLPSDDLAAKAVVFELECPEALNIWRSATYKILCDLGGSMKERAETHCTLAEYDGLSQWSSRLKSSNHRITIASFTKSFLHSHYASTEIPANQDAVCVNNGLTCQLFDSVKHTWAADPSVESSFAKYGSLTLHANSPYRYLQFSLEGTSHTSNQILADQSGCPKDLSLHEHYAFGTLRSGPRLQWMNMVRGLEENILTYSHEEVNQLHTQAAWQIGLLSEDGVTRDWHIELRDPEYGCLLVDQAMRVLNRVRVNWLEATSVQTIVMLIARLLSSATDTKTRIKAYRFLGEARAVTFGWLRQLSSKLRDAKLESQVLDYQHRVCEMAAICRSTYDVDAPHLRELLSGPKDCLELISCSVILYDNQPPKLQNASQTLQKLLARDRRLMYKSLPIVLEKLKEIPRLLDDSVSRCWNGYRPSPSGWVSLPAPNSRWVSTGTMSVSGGASQRVHFNLLNGSLLVDGQPLGRLPRNYVAHPTYTRLFGQKVLDVVPADSPGMVFTTRNYIDGNLVSFCIENSSGELVIQAQREGTTFQLIPHSKLANDFPFFFSWDYHHWIDLDTKIVEFRPLTSPWVSRDKNWKLYFSNPSICTMEKPDVDGSTVLLDVHSPTFNDIARQIDPLESSRYLHVTRSSRSPAQDFARVTVKLPRMKLTFFVNEHDQLESDNLGAHVIDEAQSTGTLFGLRNQLVLRAKDPIKQSLPQSRTVLIPYGDVKFGLQNHHVQVTIDRGSGRHLAFYLYKVDTDLGYLASSNTSLTSRLFKIYLHAVTSHCLPDPLTGRTGTEEALYELSEAATSSFEQLDQNQARLLGIIGALTPRRVYYPVHLEAMQTVKWANLPPLAQHYAFCTAANAILERAHSLKIFNPLNFDLKRHETEFNPTLLKRAAYRTRIYYPADAAARLSTILGDPDNDDSWSYEGRDYRSTGWTQNGQLASWASGLVHKRWDKPTCLTFNLVSQMESWNNPRLATPRSTTILDFSLQFIPVSLHHGQPV
ncbi:hypothetical protein FRC07_002686 [Ceratobasidium sp. 392]|nr:hypothetical protein FRC07_002686 [Ceratobasidium sp. 392]